MLSKLFLRLYKSSRIKMRTNRFWNKRDFAMGFFIGWIFTVLSFYIIFMSKMSLKDPMSPSELIKRPEARVLLNKGYYHFAYTVPPPFPRHFKLLKNKFNDKFIYKFNEKNTIAETLKNTVKVFCFINTEGKFHKTRARHVKATWASHCNQYIFFSSRNDPSLPAINLNIALGREHLWMKTKSMLHYLENHISFDDFDWFYRADDDTYAIMENLRMMLLPYSPNDNYYFGFHANASGVEHRNDSFVASGAGFLLSRSAIKKLMRDGLTDESKCEQGDHVFDDQKLSDCLANLGIPVTDSRDRLGRHRFMAVPPDRVLVPVQLAKADSNWIHYWTQYPLKQGPECCSDYAVAFHYVEPPMMYLMEYLIYHFKAFGIGSSNTSQISIKDAITFSKNLN